MTQQWVDPEKPRTVTLGLVLRQSTVNALLEHCRRAVPEEACGLIVARDGDGATRFVPIRNAHPEPRHHWRMDAEEYRATLEDLRVTGERLIAVCHSHPAGPPHLSAQDRAAALDPALHYVLVYFGEGVWETSVTSWRVVGGEAVGEGVQVTREEPLQIKDKSAR